MICDQNAASKKAHCSGRMPVRADLTPLSLYTEAFDMGTRSKQRNHGARRSHCQRNKNKISNTETVEEKQRRCLNPGGSGELVEGGGRRKRPVEQHQNAWKGHSWNGLGVDLECSWTRLGVVLQWAWSALWGSSWSGLLPGR